MTRGTSRDFFLFSIFWQATSAAADIAPLVTHFVKIGRATRFLEYSDTICLPVSSTIEETRLNTILLFKEAPTEVNAALAEVLSKFNVIKMGEKAQK
jgi:hypothetical protein